MYRHHWAHWGSSMVHRTIDHVEYLSSIMCSMSTCGRGTPSVPCQWWYRLVGATAVAVVAVAVIVVVVVVFVVVVAVVVVIVVVVVAVVVGVVVVVLRVVTDL